MISDRFGHIHNMSIELCPQEVPVLQHGMAVAEMVEAAIKAKGPADPSIRRLIENDQMAQQVIQLLKHSSIIFIILFFCTEENSLLSLVIVRVNERAGSISIIVGLIRVGTVCNEEFNHIRGTIRRVLPLCPIFATSWGIYNNFIPFSPPYNQFMYSVKNMAGPRM